MKVRELIAILQRMPQNYSIGTIAHRPQYGIMQWPVDDVRLNHIECRVLISSSDVSHMDPKIDKGTSDE